MSDFFVYSLIVIGSVVLTVLFTRWVFAISAIKANLKAQTILLAKIAVNAGVPKDEVQATLNVLDREL